MVLGDPSVSIRATNRESGSKQPQTPVAESRYAFRWKVLSAMGAESDPRHEGCADGARDRVISHVYSAGLTLAAVLGMPRVEGELQNRVRDALAMLDLAIQELQTAAFARRDGDVFYDVTTNAPLYFEDGVGHCTPPRVIIDDGT